MNEVLLVIHDDDLRRAFCWLLEDAGYVVSGAPNGITAFARLVRSSQPLIVILDTQLPERDAAEKLLDLASASGSLGRHRYILLSTTRPEKYSPALAFYRATMRLPVLTIPCDTDAMLRVIAETAALPAPERERELASEMAPALACNS